jgi:hypothetical protein
LIFADSEGEVLLGHCCFASENNMRPLHIILPGSTQVVELKPAPHHFLCVGALAVCAVMLTMFVQLLHDAVARGEQYAVAAPREVRSHSITPPNAVLNTSALVIGKQNARLATRVSASLDSVNSDALLPSQTTR